MFTPLNFLAARATAGVQLVAGVARLSARRGRLRHGSSGRFLLAAGAGCNRLGLAGRDDDRIDERHLRAQLGADLLDLVGLAFLPQRVEPLPAAPILGDYFKALGVIAASRRGVSAALAHQSSSRRTNSHRVAPGGTR